MVLEGREVQAPVALRGVDLEFMGSNKATGQGDSISDKSRDRTS